MNDALDLPKVAGTGRPAPEPPRRWAALERLFPGLFAFDDAGVAGAERRIVLGLTLAVVAAGTFVVIFTAQSALLPWVAEAWVGVLLACAIPWGRLRHASFAIVSAVGSLWVASLVRATGGLDSPYSGLFYLSAMLGAAVVPPLWLGIVMGAVAAGVSLAPLAYDPDAVRAPDEILVRSGLVAATGVFGSWLIHELTRVVGLASSERRARGHEQQIAADLRRAQNLRQEYMSVLAHELRNPLIAVGAAARVVAKDLQGKPSEAMAHGIVQEVQHALQLLDGLTDVSSLESGRLRIVLRETELTSLIRSTLNGQAPDHVVRLVGLDRPVVVLADESRIGQVLRNLVGNAAKYAPAGTTIEVSLGLASDRSHAVVQVRDEGPGIPPLERTKLFERFARLSTAGATRGSGLGLYISRGIIRDHGGELSADWPPGGGTIFSFTLPLAKTAAR